MKAEVKAAIFKAQNVREVFDILNKNYKTEETKLDWVKNTILVNKLPEFLEMLKVKER